MVDYFQIKYLISECFYYEVYVNEHSYEQAAGICREAFGEYIGTNDITSIIAKSTIILLKYRHKVNVGINDINSIKDIVKVYEKLNDTIFLNKGSIDFFVEEIEFLKEKVLEYGNNT